MKTLLPSLTLDEFPIFKSFGESSGDRSSFMNAISFYGSFSNNSALIFSPLRNLTFIFLAPRMTCQLVTAYFATKNETGTSIYTLNRFRWLLRFRCWCLFYGWLEYRWRGSWFAGYNRWCSISGLSCRTDNV